jgi:hypothetical protein
MPVVVVRADRDQGHAGAGGRQEVRIDVGASVVRHLEHVGVQVGAAGEDARLGLRAEVAGEQHPDAVDGDPGDDGQVVGRRPRGGQRRRRGQHVQGRGTDDPALPRQQRLAAGTGPAGHPVHPPDPVVGRGQRPGRDHVDRPSGQRAGQSSGVVGVEVGQQHHPEPVDPQPVQAAVHRADVRSSVHQHPLTRPGGHHQGVALPHVAGDHHRRGRRPARQQLPHRPPDDDQADDRRNRQRAQPRPPPQQHGGSDEQDGEQGRAGGPGRPRGDAVGHRGRPLGHRDEPPHRPARRPHEDTGRRGQHRVHEHREQAEDRGRRHGRGGQQVGRQRDQADLAVQPGDHRCGGQPGCRAHRDRVGHEGRPAAPAQRPRPRPGDQHDRAGRRHREQEAAVGGEPRIGHEQHHHGGAQRGYRRPDPSGGQRGERDRAHRGRAEHARLRPGQDDEAGQRQRPEKRLRAPVHRPAAQRPQHPGDRDRHVGAGDGGQVGQARAAEVLGEHGVEAGGVPDHEPGQQPRGGLGQDPCRRPGQPGAQPGRDARRRARRSDRGGRPAGGHDGDHGVAGPGRRCGHPGLHRLAGDQVRPAVGRGEQQHRVVEAGGRRRVAQPRDGRAGEHPGRSGPSHGARDAVQFQHHGGGPPVLGQRAQRGALVGQTAHAGRAAAQGHAREQSEYDEPGAAAPPAGQRRGEDQRGQTGAEQCPGRQPGGGQRGAPDAARGGQQPQVDPGPADGPGTGAHTVTRAASRS